MTSSIGGSVTGQVSLDASGVVSGAKDGAKAVADMSASFTRSSADLSAAETHYNAMADSMTRAASQAELLTARMLKASSATSAAGSRGRQSASSIIGGMSGSGREQAFQQSITARINEFASNRSSAKMASGMSAAGAAQSQSGSFANRITDWSRIQTVKNADYEQARIETENRVQRIAAGAAAGHTRQVMAHIREQEQARLDAEQRVERIAAGAAAGRARQVIAYIREQEQARLDAEQRVERIAAGAAAGRARQTIAAIRQQQQAVSENANVVRSMAAIGRLQGADTMLTATMGPMTRELNMAEEAMARMRGHMDPMVGMQQRLADEAREVRNYLRDQVVTGRMTLSQAQAQAAAYQAQSAALLTHAQAQQGGFLGMRRMGFAAQQFGYAIEDAASVYGTMGLAGAFRAAGNNLTAMAAQAGPVAGIIASLASAGIALGINFYNAAQESKKLKEQLEKIEDLTKRINERWRTQIDTEQRIADLANASHSERMAAFDQTLAKLKEINAGEEARLKTEDQMVEMAKRNAEQKQAHEEAQFERKLWWYNMFGAKTREQSIADRDAVLSIGTAYKEAYGSIPDWFKSPELRKKEEEEFNAESRATIELNRQEAILKRLNSVEQKRLDNMKEQWDVLKGSVAAMGELDSPLLAADQTGGSSLTEGLKYERAARGEYDVRRSSSMHVRQSDNITGPRMNFLGGGLFKSSITDTDTKLVAAEKRLKHEQDILVAQREQTTDAKEQARLQSEIAAYSEERLRVDQMRQDLNAAGQTSFDETNQSIMGRFEGLNEELRIENEVLRTRKKINEEIDIATRSGHMTAKKADEYRAELESVLKLEEERRNNDKEIERLQKREGTLEGLARQALNPATVIAGLTKGSDEARAFLENERLKSMAQKDADPQIKELRDIRAEIKRLRESNEKIGQSKPGVVTL